jgi:hypothetical protein
MRFLEYYFIFWNIRGTFVAMSKCDNEPEYKAIPVGIEELPAVVDDHTPQPLEK